MPRTNNANLSQIEAFLARVALFKQSNLVNRQNFQEIELLAFRNFPDKAFKAFYARKILRLPASIAAEVFGVTTGLISQAEATEVTISRTGRPRNPNVYSAANRNASSLNELGKFAVPNRRGFDVGIEITIEDRKTIFTNFAKLAIVQNRGADVVSFQPRMVASYMSEGDAISLKSYTLPRWRQVVFNHYSSVASQEPTQTATPEPQTEEALDTPNLAQNTREALVRAGFTTGQADSFMVRMGMIGVRLVNVAEGNNQVRITVSRGRNTTLDRVNIQAKVNRALIELGLPPSQNLEIRSDGDYTIVINEATSTATPEPTSAPSDDDLEYRPTAMHVQRMSEQNSAVLDLIAAGADRDTANALTEALANRSFNFKVRNRTGNVISYRLKYFGNTVNAPQSSAVKQLIEGILMLDDSDVTMGVRQEDLVGEITFPSAQASAQAETATETTATAQEATPAVELTTRQDLRPHMQDAVGYPDAQRAEATLRQFQAMGYNPSQVRSVLNFLWGKNLFIFKLTTNVQGGNVITDSQGGTEVSTPFNIMEVQSLAGAPQRFRTSTWVSYLRTLLPRRDYGTVFPDARRNTQLGRRQRATFRTRMGANIGFLHLPNLTRLAPTSQATQTTTASPQTGTGEPNVQRSLQATPNVLFVGYQVAPSGQLFRSGNLPFIKSDQVQPGEGGQKSYMFYWWDETTANFYQLPAGRMDLVAGAVLSRYDTLNMLTQDPPGQLKLYTSDTVNALVSQSILATGGRIPTFTPQRLPTRVADLTINVGDYYRWTQGMATGQRQMRLQGLSNVTSDRIQMIDASGASVGSGQPSSTQSGLMRGLTNVTSAQMKAVGKLPFVTNDKGKASFGVEFEGHNLNLTRRVLAQKMSQAGFPMRATGYTHNEMPGEIKLTTDITVFPQRNPPGGDHHFEMVTNLEKSQGEAGLKYVKGTLDKMQELGARIDRTSGIHIHLDNSRWTQQHMINLAINFAIIEPWLSLSVPAWRRPSRTYASTWYSNWSDSQVEDLKASTNKRQMIAATEARRERRLNITCARGYPTWELRFPASNTDAATIEAHIMMYWRLSQISAYGVLDYKKLDTATRPASYETYLEDFLGTDVYTWFRNRQYDLAQPNELINDGSGGARSGLRNVKFNNVLKVQ